MTAQGTLIAGRYRLERRIGAGAMGVVWESLDERLNRTVAVKQLLLVPGLEPDERDEAVERTMREGRIAARLHHPNAIAVFDVVDNDGIPCLVMEYLPSRSLDDVIRERGFIAPGDVATIGAQVASALTAAHAAGIVHRDIKPGNVLLGRGGQVKITDFGISRATDDITVTKTGLIAGTPAYLAPEVAVGRDPEPPSDVFSLGSTLYAAVEGEPPFGLSDNTLSLLHVVARGQINPPRQAGPLTDVLIALLRPDPADRPDAQQAAGMLRAVAQGQRPDIPPGADATTALLAPPGAPATRAMTSPMPTQARAGGGTRPGMAPTSERAQHRPPPEPRSRRGGPLLAALGLLVLAAVVIGGLYATGVLGRSNNTPQLPVAPSTSQTPTTSPTTKDETTRDTTTTETTTETTTPRTTTRTTPPRQPPRTTEQQKPPPQTGGGTTPTNNQGRGGGQPPPTG